MVLVTLGMRSAGATRGDPRQPLQRSPRPARCMRDRNTYLVTACHTAPCEPVHQYRESAAIVELRDTPENEPHYKLASQSKVGSEWSLVFSSCEDALLAAAYHKVQSSFGHGGPGAVYRSDLSDLEMTEVASVPDLEPDLHERQLKEGPHNPGRHWSGRTSLADLDIDAENAELFVVNLNDHRIYR